MWACEEYISHNQWSEGNIAMDVGSKIEIRLKGCFFVLG